MAATRRDQAAKPITGTAAPVTGEHTIASFSASPAAAPKPVLLSCAKSQSHTLTSASRGLTRALTQP